jgi:hypothetical protein
LTVSVVSMFLNHYVSRDGSSLFIRCTYSGGSGRWSQPLSVDRTYTASSSKTFRDELHIMSLTTLYSTLSDHVQHKKYRDVFVKDNIWELTGKYLFIIGYSPITGQQSPRPVNISCPCVKTRVSFLWWQHKNRQTLAKQGHAFPPYWRAQFQSCRKACWFMANHAPCLVRYFTHDTLERVPTRPLPLRVP